MQKMTSSLWIMLMVFLLVSSCESNENTSIEYSPGPKTEALTLRASGTELVEAFNWAKQQALSYAHNGEDPVGKWYEAALPNRQAFCMRDVAHQLTGANVLGLYEHNDNMLYKFAVNISESKDWCSYWEINKEDQPAPVDYRNDKEFWYNLPANFDILQAAYNHYLWTGNKQMIKDSVFLNFYERTLTDYIERWDLSLDKVYTRKRFMNMVEKVDSSDYFHVCRGIPGYDEGQGGRMTMGLDQLAIMGAAFRSAADIAHKNGDTDLMKAHKNQYEEIKTFIHEQWWDQDRQSFKTFLMDDGTFKYAENKSVLYYKLTDDPEKWQPTIKDLQSKVKEVNIETASHLPEVFFQYGEHEAAYDALIYLCDENTNRREYPEVSFAVVGSIATGLMGIEPDARTYSLTTVPRLTDSTAWVELSNVPVLQNGISLRHDGLTKSTLTNNAGRKLSWKAFFPGQSKGIMINGEAAGQVIQMKDVTGQLLSGVRVNVEVGQRVVVEVGID
jgi:hypothetical protein